MFLKNYFQILSRLTNFNGMTRVIWTIKLCEQILATVHMWAKFSAECIKTDTNITKSLKLKVRLFSFTWSCKGLIVLEKLFYMLALHLIYLQWNIDEIDAW